MFRRRERQRYQSWQQAIMHSTALGRPARLLRGTPPETYFHLMLEPDQLCVYTLCLDFFQNILRSHFFGIVNDTDQMGLVILIACTDDAAHFMDVTLDSFQSIMPERLIDMNNNVG
jgi:hypothetical protein